MSSKYFTLLPTIDYNIYDSRLNETTKLTNILIRNKIRQDVLNNASLYYPYYVEEDERPDIVSFNYYGDTKFTWIIFFANEVIDPFFEWPLSQNQFESFIKNKYGSLESSKTTVHHYERIIRPATSSQPEFSVEISEDYYNTSDATRIIDEDKKRSVSQYDYEIRLNNDKRKINLIEDSYVNQIFEDARRAFA